MDLNKDGKNDFGLICFILIYVKIKLGVLTENEFINGKCFTKIILCYFF